MLEADDAGVDDEGEPHAEPAPIQKFRASAVGSVLAAGMLGLRDIFETPKDDEPAIVEDWSGGQPLDDPLLMRLDPDHPEDSIVVVRPWLKQPRTNG